MIKLINFEDTEKRGVEISLPSPKVRTAFHFFSRSTLGSRMISLWGSESSNLSQSLFRWFADSLFTSIFGLKLVRLSFFETWNSFRNCEDNFVFGRLNQYPWPLISLLSIPLAAVSSSLFRRFPGMQAEAYFRPQHIRHSGTSSSSKNFNDPLFEFLHVFCIYANEKHMSI